MQNSQIADIIGEMATLMELLGENPFKCRAFQNAARLISTSTEDLQAHARAGTLTSLKGVGKGLAPIIADLALRGKSEDFDTLRASVPGGLSEMLKVQGLGPKKVRLLYEKLGIDTLDGLRKAASGDSLIGVGGFGKKSLENLIKSLDSLERFQDKRLLWEGDAAADIILKMLSGLPGVHSCSVAGSLRRRMPVIGDIDILVAAAVKYHQAIIRGLTAHADVTRVLGSGPTKASVHLLSGVQCDLRVVTPSAYPYALMYFTGSKEHNVTLRSRAAGLGLSLNEYGFTGTEQKSTTKAATRPSDRKPRKPLSRCQSEADIYLSLGMEYIPPEMREDFGEIEAATLKRLPHLIETNDFRGTFHCHTTYSDGRNTLTEMVQAGRGLGWEYLGIADHSKAATYAGGLSEKDVSRQLAEIQKLNGDQRGFRIFSGTEVDILADGTLDWKNTVLARFDYVVASIHSKFTMTEDEATRRVVKALKNKYVTMLGHPTGRLLLQREGYQIRMKEVIDAASDYGKMIEINANPRRLDLDWTLCRYARDKGVMIVINPDAHSIAGLADVRYGVDIARKGWLEPGDVLNTKRLPAVAGLLSH